MATGKGFLRIAIEDFLVTWGFGTRIKAWVNNVLETWEDEALDSYEKLLAELGIDHDTLDILKPSSLRKQVTHPAQLLLILIPVLFAIVSQLAGYITTPFLRKLTYWGEQIARTQRPDIGILLQMIRKHPESGDDLRALLGGTGYSKDLIISYDKLIDNFLTADDYQRLKLRGFISSDKTRDKLSKLGYLREEIDGLDELSKLIPSPSDLISMAVREAFDEDYISRYQTAEGISPEFQEWARKQGLGDEWSRRYWIAHWQLPSPQQVFEMLHRLRPGKTDTPIVDKDVNDYLKAADYSPFWRDKLKAISYNPFTRVDVRRMYKTGVLNAEQVKDAYLDLGYSDEKATALTEFTLVYEAEEETGVVRTSVIQAYGDGMITRSTAEGMLSGGGYDPTTIAFYLDSVDFREALQVTQIKLQNIHKRFVEGILDETTVSGEMGMLNLPAERVTAMLELWVTERQNQVSIPTLTQVENFYELGIATLDDFKRILKQRGYSQESIDWNIERIDIEKSIKATKELEKAQADEERLAKSKTASKYQKDKAKLDLDIAQAKAEMTDIDIALHGELEDNEIETFMSRKDELKNAISEINVNKAQLHFDVAKALEIK